MDGGIESGSTLTTDNSMDEEGKTSSIDSLIRKPTGSVGDTNNLADILLAISRKKVEVVTISNDHDEGRDSVGEEEEEDDELTDHSVNLVVLDEVAGKKFSKI